MNVTEKSPIVISFVIVILPLPLNFNEMPTLMFKFQRWEEKPTSGSRYYVVQW